MVGNHFALLTLAPKYYEHPCVIDLYPQKC